MKHFKTPHSLVKGMHAPLCAVNIWFGNPTKIHKVMDVIFKYYILYVLLCYEVSYF